MADYHAQFLNLVDEIERTYPVIHWQIGDVPAWPLARAALHLNIVQEKFGEGGAKGHRARLMRGRAERIAQAAARIATPLINIWQSRSDFRNMLLLPHRASALFLGDEKSLDFVDGAWKDRFCDPLIVELRKAGRSTLLMQRGDFRRLPWKRPTFAANTIVHWAQLFGMAVRLPNPQSETLPDHDAVLEFISLSGVPLYGLEARALRSRAAEITAAAYGFQQLLKIVRPTVCFMVGYHWGLGHALTMACRCLGVLSVELQRMGLAARSETYCYSRLPRNGYIILPAVFWTWTEHDAAAIERWSSRLESPWHRGLHGGHPQMLPWFDDNSPESRATDAQIEVVRSRSPADLDILVALQHLPGYEQLWNGLASLIEESPARWRWWIRIHPVPNSGPPPGRLLTIRRRNVLVDEASSLPLPALLRQMNVHISLSSGSAVEASMFGVKCIFLDLNASEKFPHLVESGAAEIVTDMAVLREKLSNSPGTKKARDRQPSLPSVLSKLDSMAVEYANLCRNH